MKDLKSERSLGFFLLLRGYCYLVARAADADAIRAIFPNGKVHRGILSHTMKMTKKKRERERESERIRERAPVGSGR